MKIGMGIPETGPQATRTSLDAWIERAEALDYSHINVSDHIVIPTAIGSAYPYSETGDVSGWGECVDQFTYLAYLAAITTSLRLLASVTVIPMRGAVHTAKVVSTIDVLSGGRMILGIGVGWLAEEFEAIGAPPFKDRGRVTDEYLQAFKALWTEDDPRFEGEHVRVADVIFEPKPVQQPHPPIWVGGESTPAMRRAVRHGDAWHPIYSNPRHPLDTLARMADAIKRLRRLAEENNRDPASVGIATILRQLDGRAGDRRRRSAETPDGRRPGRRRRHPSPRRARRRRPRARLPARVAGRVPGQHAVLRGRSLAPRRIAG